MAAAHYQFPAARIIRGTDIHRLKADHRGAVMILQDAGVLIISPEVLRTAYHAYELYVSHPDPERGRVEARILQVRIPLEAPPTASSWPRARRAIRTWWLAGLVITLAVAFLAWGLR